MEKYGKIMDYTNCKRIWWKKMIKKFLKYIYTEKEVSLERYCRRFKIKKMFKKDDRMNYTTAKDCCVSLKRLFFLITLEKSSGSFIEAI